MIVEIIAMKLLQSAQTLAVTLYVDSNVTITGALLVTKFVIMSIIAVREALSS